MIFDGQIVTFFVVFFIVHVVVTRLSGKRRSSKVRSPPCLPSLPIIGSLPFLRQINNISEFFMKKSYQLGPIFTLRVGSRLILVLNSKNVIREALVKKSRYFSSRPEIYADNSVNPNRKGISFGVTTPQWKWNHQVALAIMKEFGYGVKTVLEERILNEIEEMLTFVRNKQGQSFNPKQISILFTSNIISNIVFGHRRDYDLGIPELITEIDIYVHNLDMVFDVAPFIKYIPSFKRQLATLAESGKKIKTIIEAEIARSLKDKVNCFVCRYIDKEGLDYDREQLNYTARDLIAGGTDTTSTTFRWMLIALANNPQIQRRLQDELDSVIPRHRLPTIQDQSKLPYHQATILEIYRWRTLLSLSVARLTTDDSMLQGYHIPVGTMVLSNLYAAHNNKTEWDDPESFRPERFLDKENRIFGSDRVISFGLGSRSCFGEMLARTEVSLILASIVQRFNVLPPEGQEKIYDNLKLPVTITTNPEPFSVRLICRE